MKRILLITYYFPPCGGAAVQRWVRFLPGLVEAGYNITVLTTDKGDYPYYDVSLLKKIPAEVEVIRTHTPVFGSLWKLIIGYNESLPYGSLSQDKNTGWLKKLLFWIRLNIILPDVRVIWTPYAYRAAVRLCRSNKFNYVITTGPPHSTHLAGLRLKKHLNINWITDFRDPWSQIYYLDIEKQNCLIKSANRYLEKKVVANADLNLVVSDYIADSLPGGKKQVLLNGYDQNDFNNMTYKKTDEFRIKYIGHLTAGQNIKPVIEQITLLTYKFETRDIILSFIGSKIPDDINTNLSIIQLEPMPHIQAISEMVNSELLILLINNYLGSKGMLTTKLFEYIASGTPILCIGPKNGEAANIINESGSGFIVDQAGDESLSYIQELYLKWLGGKPRRNLGATSQWSVQQQIKELTHILS